MNETLSHEDVDAIACGDPVVGAVPVRDQLAHLDRLVAAHETYWAAVAQQNPRSGLMREFLRRHWDPWFTNWTEARSRLDHQRTVIEQGVSRLEPVPASADAVATFVRGAAQGLSSIRELAAYNGIPTPDLGTAQHGFIHLEEPRVAGLFASDRRPAVSGDQGEGQMSAYAGWDYVGADGGSYPEVASRAVTSISRQNPSPVYGYLRAGAQQKIYLFGALEDARGWITALIHGQAQPYDYAAVFAATDLARPVPGLESFGHTLVSGDAAVGQWLPFLLGIPAGALGGYLYRGWQEKHPGKIIPGISGDYSGDYSVGGPWLDVIGNDPYVGGPWLDIIGAQAEDSARRRAWPQTRALIESAKREVSDYNASYPAAAWVWSLDPPGPSPRPGLQLAGTTMVAPFSSREQALDYMRSRIQTDHVALALFDTASPRWPNPVNWTKNDDPAYEPVIAQHVARSAPSRAAGDYDYVGAYPSQTTIGSALDDVRSRAQSLANKRAGSVIGVIHTRKDGLWHALAFRNTDDADDWLGTATHDPASYTYAAYYDKEDVQWPHPVNEKIGGLGAPEPSGPPIRREVATTMGDVVGAVLDDVRRHAKALATAKPGNAVGVIRTADGLWHRLSFGSLDEAVDWLQTATRDRASFTYAAIFEKAADGTAYFQDEEVGGSRAAPEPGPPIRREVATTSGVDAWWSA